MTTAAAELASIVREVFRVREPETVSAWADRSRVLLARSEAEPGPWRTDRTPYLRTIMDRMGDPAVTRVTIAAAERVGKTEALINYFGWGLDNGRNGGMLWVLPNADLARAFNKRRFIRNVRGCPAMAAHLIGYGRDVTSLEVNFRTRDLQFAGSNSEANLESFGYPDVAVDEFDRCDAETLGIVLGRGITFRNRRLILMGSMGDEEAGIHGEYLAGSQETYHVPCPLCWREHGAESYFRREFSHVRWRGGTGADPAKVEKEAWYECPRCAGKIEAAWNLWQLRAGIWVPRGCTVEVVEEEGEGEEGPAGSRRSRPVPRVAGEPERSAEHSSFWVEGLLSPFPPNVYGYIASEFVKNKGVPTRQWVTRRQGHPWRAKGEHVNEHHLARLARAVSDGGYALGTVPADVVAIVVTADVQADRMYVQATGYTAYGIDDVLIDFAVLERTRGDALEALDAWAMQTWPRVGSDERMGAWRVGIDHGHYSDRVEMAVRRLAATMGTGRVWPVKGRTSAALIKHLQIGSTNDEIDRARRRGTRPSSAVRPRGGMRLLLIDVNHYKTARMDKQSRSYAQVELAEEERVDGVGVVRLPDPLTCTKADRDLTEYLKQVTGEQRVFDERRRCYEWKMRPGRVNHWMDTDVYNAALAEFAGIRQIGPAGIPVGGRRLVRRRMTIRGRE